MARRSSQKVRKRLIDAHFATRASRQVVNLEGTPRKLTLVRAGNTIKRSKLKKSVKRSGFRSRLQTNSF